MDTPEQPADTPEPASARGGLGRALRAAAPFALTAAIAVALSFATQLLWPPTAQPAIAVPTAGPAAAPTNAPTPRPIATAPTAPPLAQGITQQELADARAEADRQQAQIYLLLAVAQIADAEAALRANDLANVDQSLVAIDSSLQLAYARYERAGDSARDAVAQRRMEVGKLHDDLYLYPEGMDQRLNRLRQLMLALVSEQPQ